MTARGAQQHDAGFTLVELLVVLAIIAIVAASGGLTFKSSLSRRVVEDTSQLILSELKFARIRAIERGITSSVAFEPNSRALITDGRGPRAIDARVALKLETARQAIQGGKQQIQFLSDGRSSGGRIEIAFEDYRRVIAVNWLTGAIGELAP